MDTWWLLCWCWWTHCQVSMKGNDVLLNKHMPANDNTGPSWLQPQWTVGSLPYVCVVTVWTSIRDYWGKCLKSPCWNSAADDDIMSNFIVRKHLDGLVQDCCISSTFVLEILQSCTKPSIWLLTELLWDNFCGIFIIISQCWIRQGPGAT